MPCSWRRRPSVCSRSRMAYWAGSGRCRAARPAARRSCSSPGQRAEALEPAFAEVLLVVRRSAAVAAREVARFLETRPGAERQPLRQRRAALARPIRAAAAAPLLTVRAISRRSSRAWPSAPADEFQATVLWWLAAYFIGVLRPAGAVARRRAAGRPRAAGRRACPDRAGVRAAPQPRRSAARHRADRPLHAGRAGRPRAGGRGVVGHGRGAVVHALRLPAAGRRAIGSRRCCCCSAAGRAQAARR